jgi:hypothetical protein
LRRGERRISDKSNGFPGADSLEIFSLKTKRKKCNEEKEILKKREKVKKKNT